MKNLVKSLISAGIVFMYSSALFAEYIILKNGTVIKGKIESSDQSSAVIAETTGEKKILTPDAIDKIITKPLYLEKLIIYKTDKTSFEAYCVDYDQNSYTFRKELKNSDELKIPAGEILYFESKLAPSGLAPEMKYGAVNLKWSDVNEKIKTYRVYNRKKGDAAYTLSGETDKPEYIIQGLESGTEYEILVRSVTQNGFESFPGKALSLTTVNLPPDRPGAVTEKFSSGSEIAITWGASKDKDGIVKGYNVYTKSGSGYEKIGSTDKTEYSYRVKNPLAGAAFMVKAFDDKGLESDGAESGIFSVNYYEVKAEFGYLTASGDLADLFSSGYCGILSFTLNNYYMHGLTFGAETGYYTFSKGKEFETFDYQSFYAIPLMVKAGYRYAFMENFFFEPSIGLGYTYAGLEYKDEAGGSVSKTEFTPIVKAGVSVSYVFNNINAGAGVYYTDIIEADAHLSSIMVSLGAGYMF